MSTISPQFDPQSGPLRSLRQFVSRSTSEAVAERCEMCSAALALEHQHLIELASRRFVCACDACAVLFDGQAGARFRRLPRRARRLSDFLLTDAQWDRLMIPINVAFFFYSSTANKTLALYPGPAGAAESMLPLESWHEVVSQNRVLEELPPDVEALLVNRLGAARGFAEAEYYLAPIDVCYKLVGLIRRHWRGLSGGSDAWRQIASFFAELKGSSAVDVLAAKHDRNGAADA